MFNFTNEKGKGPYFDEKHRRKGESQEKYILMYYKKMINNIRRVFSQNEEFYEQSIWVCYQQDPTALWSDV